MSKRFDGIAIAKDLGQDNGANSSVLENVKCVLYAENINSVIYYDKNLDQLNDEEAPTKKYVLSLRDTNDYIQISISDFNNWGYTKLKFINSINQAFGETDPESVMTTIDGIYRCYPSNSGYRMEWNGKTYYKWNCISYYYNSVPYTKYFLTETCNYTELQQRTMQYAYERGLAYWDKTHKLSTISVAEFDEDDNEIDYIGDRISDAHDLRITDIEYIKNANSTTIDYDDVQGVKYVDIKIGDGKEQSTCDWITLTIGPGSATATDKHYVCNPSDPNYIFTYNNLKYFLWKYIGTGNADEAYWNDYKNDHHAYFITSIADYDVLLNCVGNTLNNYLIAEFDNFMGEVKNILGSNKITSVSHFPGLYFKSVGITEIGMVHDEGSDINNPNIEYSTNYGRSWSKWNGSTILLFDNRIIWFRGLNPNGFNNSYNDDIYSKFTIGGSGTILAYGSIMSLIDQIGELLTIPSNNNNGCFYNLFRDCNKLVKAPLLPATGLADYCYAYMFYGCTSLSEAPVLPATSLATGCYYGIFMRCTSLSEAPALPAISLATLCYAYMFNGCTSLSEAPALPATGLASGCYNGMFYGCAALKKAPVLPATSLATLCYAYMFRACTALKKAPALPATSLATLCYYGMFWGCTSLTDAPALPATSLANGCYSYMFYGCTSLSEAPALPATNLANGCYSYMFYGCTGLTDTPILRATSLVNSCYHYMFYGCKNLSYIHCRANTNITTTNCNNWVNGVAPYGTFVKTYSATAWSTGVSGIPTNWMSSFPDIDNKNFVSVHILLDPKITSPSITISFTSRSSSHFSLQYLKTGGLWTSAKAGDSVTITGTEILYLRGTLNGNSTTKDYTNILITSSNESKAILSGNCNAIWNFLSPSSSLSYSGCGCNLFRNSKALVKVNKKFLPATSLANSCYAFMFLGCTSLTEAPALPATSLVTSCYEYMFEGCTSLKNAPALPATSLTTWCYECMFKNCTSLTEAPALPAMSLATYCYESMFNGCTSLTEAPALPATNLATGCYEYMFSGCTSLTKAPILPATRLTGLCYHLMFWDCKNLSNIICNAVDNITTNNCDNWVNGVVSHGIVTPYGTFYKNPSASWTTGPSGIPSGWDSISLNNINSVDNCIEIRLDVFNDVNIVFAKISSNHTLQYKDSNHNSWTTVSTGNTIKLTYTGNPVVLLRGNLSAANTKSNYTLITITGGPVKLIGNCNYLWNSDPNAALKNYCGYKLFYGSTAITKVSKNFLPATSLASGCYRDMFYGCTSLSEAPALPATSLATYCYSYMFLGCTSLKKAPVLHATSLVTWCYCNMFYGCTSLSEAPALPATSLATYCYSYMFLGCTSLKKAPVLHATSLAALCYYGMFYGCTGLTDAPALPATSLATLCYYGMFRACTSLKKAPALPATILASGCYENMFYGCTSLSEAPALPATSLAITYCYSYMFLGCTSLKKAPALPATNLATGCYEYMFSGCTSLSEAPALPATSLANGCYSYMFYGCTSLSEAPALPATNLANGCYSYMFYGCTSLNEVICFATSNSYSDSTTDWLTNASSYGQIYSKTSTNISVPSGWRIQIF